MEEKRDTTFEIRWGFVLLGLVLGIFGLIISLFTQQDRRDKIYSTLFGCSLSLLLNFLVFYVAKLPMPF